jgi:hypothetical protein
MSIYIGKREQPIVYHKQILRSSTKISFGARSFRITRHLLFVDLPSLPKVIKKP